MRPRTTVLSTLLASAVLVTSASQAHAVMAGSNMYIDYNEEIDVPYTRFVGEYFLDTILIHSPWSGPFFKHFESPITDTGQPIFLDAEQPWPQRVNENYYLPPILAPILTLPVAGWHEKIFTDGWEWVIPGDPRFPGLFPDGQSLITRNGKPHPSWIVPSVLAVYEPEKLWIEFPPIGEGDSLDIHKALLWVGTPGNHIWGDNMTDDGAYLDESAIRVFEYPVAKHANPMPGDLDGDGFVGYHDMDIVLNNWNRTVPPANPLADVAAPDGYYADGYVGLPDLDTVLANWNDGVRAADNVNIPEPAALSLILPGLLCLIRRH